MKGKSVFKNNELPILKATNILEFDPIKFKWNNNSKVPYSFLIDTFSLVANTKSRIKIINYLTNMLRTIILHDPKSVLPAFWLSSNSIAPSYEGMELGIGSNILTKAISEISGCSSQKLKKYYDRYGDWGDVAYAAKVSVRTIIDPTPLTIDDVYNTLCSISKLKGSGTVKQKTNLVTKLLVSCKGEEIRYLTRTLIQNLRIGAVRTTSMISLARAFCLTKPLSSPGTSSSSDIMESDKFKIDPKKDSKVEIEKKLKEAEKLLKECYAQFPNFNDIIKCLLEHPIDKLLDVCHLTIGVPLRPMLSKMTQDLPQIFKKLEGKPFNCEYKYDGQRAQIHMDSNDIVQIIPKIRNKNVNSFIMDSEVVAIDEDGNLQNFQALSNRSRKNVKLSSISVRVCIFVFDLMYLNGEPLLKSSLRHRLELLRNNFLQIPNYFEFVKQIESSDPEEIQEFFKNSTEMGCEGIMVKVLDDPPLSLEKNQRMNLLASYEP
ncbi:11178_t:CDS:2, partial [Diversispora eburnea]